MSKALIWVAGSVILLVLVAVSTISLTLAGGALIVAVGLCLLVALGPARLGVVLMVAGMFLAPQDALRPGIGVATIADVCFGAGMLLLLPVLLTHRARLPLGFALTAIALVVVSASSSLLADDPVASLSLLLRFALAWTVLPMVFLQWRPEASVVDRLAWGFVAGQVVSTLWALVDGPLGNARYVGNTTHPNMFALSGLLALAMLPHLYYRVPPSWRWVVWPTGVVCAYSIQLSGGRAALLSLVVLIVLYPMVERSVMSAYLLVAGAVAAVPLLDTALRLLGASETSAVGRLLGRDDSSEHADDSRRTTMSEGWGQFTDSPILGSGFADILRIHNIYLEVLVAVGIVGFVLWLLLFGHFLLPLFRAVPLRRLGYVPLVYAIFGMAQPSLWDNAVWSAMSLALLAAVVGTGDSPPGHEDRGRHRLPAAPALDRRLRGPRAPATDR